MMAALLAGGVCAIRAQTTRTCMPLWPHRAIAIPSLDTGRGPRIVPELHPAMGLRPGSAPRRRSKRTTDRVQRVCLLAPPTAFWPDLHSPLQIDTDGSKQIEYKGFEHAIRLNKSLAKKQTTEQDTIDAFAALGGNVSKGRGEEEEGRDRTAAWRGSGPDGGAGHNRCHRLALWKREHMRRAGEERQGSGIGARYIFWSVTILRSVNDAE